MGKSKLRRRPQSAGGGSKNEAAAPSQNRNNKEKLKVCSKSKETSSIGRLLLSVVVIGIIFAVMIRRVSNPLPLPSSMKEPKQDEETTESQHRTEIQDKDTPADYKVLQVYPHDVNAFTQGLTFGGGSLYEGTGMNGESEIRRIHVESGTSLSSHRLHERYFGEGIAYFTTEQGEARIIQLTWTTRMGFIYDADTFRLIQEFDYDTVTHQGWGVTYNPSKKEFIVSDGSSWLLFWDRDTLKETRRVPVRLPHPSREQQRAVPHINELEWDRGTLLANVWYQDVLLRIDAETGLVQKVYDFRALYPMSERPPSADCFNGISLTDTPSEIYLTGKNWPHLYRVRLLS